VAWLRWPWPKGDERAGERNDEACHNRALQTRCTSIPNPSWRQPLIYVINQPGTIGTLCMAQNGLRMVSPADEINHGKGDGMVELYPKLTCAEVEETDAVLTQTLDHLDNRQLKPIAAHVSLAQDRFREAYASCFGA
jgi:hypothetical protein